MKSPESNPIALHGDQLVMLLDEVCAMVASGRPLMLGIQALIDTAPRNVGRAAELIRSGLEQGKPLAESIAAVSTTYQASIRVALETMAETGSSEPIYEVVRLIRDANEERRRFRYASINPILNVLVAAGVAFFVMPWILVQLSEAELIKSAFAPSIQEIYQTFAKNFFLTAFATLTLVGLFTSMYYWGLQRAQNDRGHLHDYATFCRWLSIQVAPSGGQGDCASGNRSLERILASAAEVVGPAFFSSWAGVIDRLRAGATGVQGLAIPNSAPEPVRCCVADLVSGTRDSQSIGNDLDSLCDLYTQQSAERRFWWTEVLPRGVSWTLLILILVFLLRAILMPLLAVTREAAQ